MLRLFVAIEIPGAQRQAIARAVEPLRAALPTARWVAEEGWHVTLKFLGHVPEERLAVVEAVLAASAAPVSPDGGSAPAHVSLMGLGAFPNERRARVVWVGLDEPGGVLAALAAGLEQRFAEEGFRTEARPWRPHLTVARLRVPGPVSLSLAGEVVADPFEVGEMVLFRSHLHHQGAAYEALRRFPLHR